MTFPHLNRRTHLYLGLFLMPWVLLYGVSSIPFSHSAYFDARDKAKGLPNWTQRFERAYDVPVPEGDLRPLAQRVVADAGLAGLNSSYGAYRQSPEQINVYVYTFWKSTQLKYFVKEKRLVCEDGRFRWDHFLTGMHAKGGFEQDGFLHDSWAVVVDLVGLAFLLWVFSGIYMWWHLPALRGWGWAALLGGCATFGLFVWLL